MNSAVAERASQEVFDQIFPIRFNDAEDRIVHKYARQERYAGGDWQGELQFSRHADEFLTRAQSIHAEEI